MPMKLAAVVLATLLINLPCGYWRESVRRFSPAWFVAIHLAVPLVVAMRHYSGLGYAWYTYPCVIAAYFGGQYIGARLRRRRLTRDHFETSEKGLES